MIFQYLILLLKKSIYMFFLNVAIESIHRTQVWLNEYNPHPTFIIERYRAFDFLHILRSFTAVFAKPTKKTTQTCPPYCCSGWTWHVHSRSKQGFRRRYDINFSNGSENLSAVSSYSISWIIGWSWYAENQILKTSGSHSFLNLAQVLCNWPVIFQALSLATELIKVDRESSASAWRMYPTRI